MPVERRILGPMCCLPFDGIGASAWLGILLLLRVGPAPESVSCRRRIPSSMPLTLTSVNRLSSPSSSEMAQMPSLPPKPKVVQFDPEWYARFDVMTIQSPTSRYSLRSVLKEFSEPLRTKDPRTDSFAVYRKESEEFDRGYAKKYDEDLNTSLIFVRSPTSVLRAGY